MTKRRALVAGAGGFIGHHLVKFLQSEAYWVRGVDIKLPEYERTSADDFQLLDLREPAACLEATADVDEVYQLAADMGGIGYITANHADIARNNILINAHMLEAAHQNGASRFFFSSSACIYPQHLQRSPDLAGLKEEDAYPADAEEGYGWEKLYSEKLCEYYLQDKHLETRVARFHNVYGPYGTYEGGREKAPAAICRKVALADDGDELEIWGDGKQSRSFMFIEDCVDGIYRIARSDHRAPLNLGTDVMVTIDELCDLICEVARKTLAKRYDPSKPQGVRGRNSDNSRLKATLSWEPTWGLRDGLRETYRWIEKEVTRSEGSKVGAAEA